LVTPSDVAAPASSEAPAEPAAAPPEAAAAAPAATLEAAPSPEGPRALPEGHKRPTLEEFVARGYPAEAYEAHMARWEAALMGVPLPTGGKPKPPPRPRGASGKVLCKVIGPGAFACEGRIWSEGTVREFNASDADSPVLERLDKT